MCENHSLKGIFSNVFGSLLRKILPDECESTFIHPATVFTLQQKTMDLLHYRPAFLHLATLNLWDRILLCCGGSPAHCGVFVSVLGFYPLDAIITLPQFWQSKLFPVFLGGKITPSWEPLLETMALFCHSICYQLGPCPEGLHIVVSFSWKGSQRK